MRSKKRQQIARTFSEVGCPVQRSLDKQVQRIHKEYSAMMQHCDTSIEFCFWKLSLAVGKNRLSRFTSWWINTAQSAWKSRVTHRWNSTPCSKTHAREKGEEGKSFAKSGPRRKDEEAPFPGIRGSTPSHWIPHLVRPKGKSSELTRFRGTTRLNREAGEISVEPRPPQKIHSYLLKATRDWFPVDVTVFFSGLRPVRCISGRISLAYRG